MLRRFLHRTHFERFSDVEVVVRVAGEAGVRAPFACRCDLRKLMGAAFVALGVVFLFFLGTLLFFRQMERNRVLEDKVIQLELAGTLQRREPVALLPPAKATSERAVLEPTPWVKELSLACETESCEAQISLLSSATGTVEGQLLMVLETSLLRIGNSPGQERKRYFTYPGAAILEEFSEANLENLQRKHFRFSRALHTQAEFVIGAQHRPLLVHAFLFNREGKIVGRGRKRIEGSELND